MATVISKTKGNTKLLIFSILIIFVKFIIEIGQMYFYSFFYFCNTWRTFLTKIIQGLLIAN